MSSSATYSSDGNRLEKTTDALGKETTYSYNADTNVLDWVQYPEDTEDTRTEYTYDSMYRMATAACETDTGASLSAEYTYTDDLLTSIVTPSTTYSFDYGVFGLRTAVRIGNRTLASYSYTDDGNYYLSALDYGNDDSVNYTYDSKGRLLTQTYEDGDTVTYKYNNDGVLASRTDSATDITTRYYYDLTGRPMKQTESGTGYSHSVGYEYDKLNNLTELVENINGTERTTTYTYDDDNRVTSSTTGNTTVTYEYDDFGRIETQTTKNGSTVILTESYTYKAPTSTTTSAQIATYTTAVPNGYSVTYSYTYDDNGNILTVSDGSNTTSYEYDSANQLIRENNQAGNFTHTWTYDNAGNILTRKEYAYTTGELGDPTDTVSYTYGDDDGDANGDDDAGNKWGDLLSAYNGNAITYDQIGNPLTDGTWTYTWQHGRQLASMSDGTTSWTFTYHSDGLRTRRTNGTTTYDYVYIGSQLRQMKVGSDTLKFAYDAESVPLTLQIGDTYYFYLTNLQGDVIGITDSTGTTVVSYTYDAWGNPLSTTGSMASNLGALNPLRYRGYVYDVETNLYYLQSRYYNPQTGRFLNGDAFATTGQGFTGNNMFAYCGNNPVVHTDVTGTRFIGEGVGGGYGYPSGSGGGGGGGGGGLVYAGPTGGHIYPYPAPSSTVPLIPFFPPSTTYGIDIQRAETMAIRRQQAQEKVKVTALVIHNTRSDDAIYYGADLRDHTWKTVTPPMTYQEAKVWTILTAVSRIYGKNAGWGLYTNEHDDALAMAWDLGYGGIPILHNLRKNEYPHYHIAGFDFFGIYKHFHIWYGSIYEG